MKSEFLVWTGRFATTIAAFSAFSGLAAFQPVSVSSLAPAAGGGGDSSAPVISADGRFVVFASTAKNLAINTNSALATGLPLAPMNVYLRDRVAGTTTLISANTNGATANSDCFPAAVSTNGQFVLFESAASDLVANDTNNASDIFVRDVLGGTTFLVSVDTNGVSGNGSSHSSVMTPDGRLIAFSSAASDLVPDDTNGIPDVFVFDRVADSTTLVSTGALSSSLTSPPSSPPMSLSDSPVISPDGRYVAFYSTATNLVDGVQASGEIYLRDLVAGTTTWVSSAAHIYIQLMLGSTNAMSFNPVLSDNGQFIAYSSCVPSNSLAFGPILGATTRALVLRYNVGSGLTDVVDVNANVPYQAFENIHEICISPDGRFTAFVGNVDGTNGTTTAVFLWDALSYQATLASGDLANDVQAFTTADWPSLSASGQYVLFVCNGTNLTTNPLQGSYHIYRRDMNAGQTVLVDVDTNGIGTGVSGEAVPVMSADARYVAFEAPDGDLVPNDTNERIDVFVRDIVAETNELVSAHDPTLPCLTPDGDSATSQLSVSSDGRFVAFSSEADNITANDDNGSRDVFVTDLYTGSNVLVSVDTNGVFSADGGSTDPSISADGRYVAFTSSADNLVTGDTNRSMDVFVRDLATGQTTAVSVSADGTTLGNADSYSPTISADGRYVLFHSKAQNLTSGTFNSGYEYLFLRDLLAGTNYALTKGSAGTYKVVASMTPDGRYVAYAPFSYSAYIWDTLAATPVYTNSPSAFTLQSVSISPDGQWLAMSGLNAVIVANRLAGTSTRVSTLAGYAVSDRGGLRFSQDGHLLVYATRPVSTVASGQVYVYDSSTGSNTLISASLTATNSGSSDSPNISADGHFVVFRSASTNLIAGFTKGIPQLVVYDRYAGTTTLLTSDFANGSPSDNRALAPIFSGDGHMIFYRSWASDLTAQDFNQRGDTFGYAFLYLSISASVAPGSGPTISWPANPGQTFQVLYKDNLTDNAWQPVNGTITLTGIRASIVDLSPSDSQRFYEVIAN